MSRKTKVLKVVLIGDSNTGKTSLMKHFERNSFNNLLKFTVVVDFLKKDVTVDGETYTLQIWDTAGQERYNSLTRPFFKGADCCLLTFALDDMRSFENLSQWKREFLHNAGIPDGKTFPFVIVGNKVDDVDNRKVDEIMVRDWCNQNDIEFCFYYETSAKDAINVDEPFKAAVERFKELETNAKEATDVKHIQKKNTVDLSKKTNQKRKCCKKN